MNLETKVKAYIEKNKMINPGEVVLAGISGGADSTCLLIILHKLSLEMDFKLVVVHVNHGLRDDAAQDALYVKKLCKERNIEYYLHEADIKKIAKEKDMTEEEAGRYERYRVFENLSVKYDAGKIAIAHNLNDLAETMLYNMFRGSGLQGMVGIRSIRGKIIRPLLETSRKEIENYLEENDIDYCTDSTNLEDDHARNRIRHHILPYAVSQINEKSIEHLAKTAQSLDKANEYIKAQAQNAMDECAEVDLQKDEIKINVEVFNTLPDILKENIILMAMEKLTPHRKDITSTHIYSIIGLCLDSRGTKKLNLPYDLIAQRIYGMLFINKNIQNVSEYSENDTYLLLDKTGKVFKEYLEIDGKFTVTVNKTGTFDMENIPMGAYTKMFDYDKIQTSLVFRHRKKGDYLMTGNGRQSLGKYMINEKIPSAKRDEIYVLADGDHILWIPGFRISSFYKVDNNTKTVLDIKIEDLT
ncbi:MAG: tRNA lysidine(34) synthetase TilS [Butyrivibrio sp.]|nr:tRNA lysidine(34) synthetase TilS [Butyrivibrio sp.]